MNVIYPVNLSTVAPECFVGRTAETEILRRHHARENDSFALLVSSAPTSGASELLKQFYDRLFETPHRTVPIYFAVYRSDASAAACARRFLHNFVAQTLAFHLRDAKITDCAFSLSELARLAADGKLERIAAFIDFLQTAEQTADERAFVRKCLSAPLRAAAEDQDFFVMLDDLHETEAFSGETNFVEEIKRAFNRAAAPFVLSGNRRFLSKATRAGNTELTAAQILPVEPLTFADAGDLIEKLAARHTVKIVEPARDLIAVKLQGIPSFIRSIIEAASEKRLDLDSFRRVEQIYAEEIFGGRIGKFCGAIFDAIAPDIKIQKEIAELFERARTGGGEEPLIENWLENHEPNPARRRRLTSHLNGREIIRLASGRVAAQFENQVLDDYLAFRYRLEINLESRAAVIGEMLSGISDARAAHDGKFYRQAAAINLSELLALFNHQEVPLALLDYTVYQKRLRQTGAAAVDLTFETEKIKLPQMIYTAHTAAFYPQIEQITERNRSAVALGFAERIYTEADATVWLAAQIDAKLEASLETTEFWCDRLEMVALTCGFTEYKIWLVAPEGFAPDAQQFLQEKNGYGSSRRQVELLAGFLRGEVGSVAAPKPVAEYEMVVPMGDESELIAAAAAEEIARRYNYHAKAVNQIKTAVVEACINASEHSLSIERKIHQQISVWADRIVITIANRGLRATDRQDSESKPGENRRGWGLKLIKTLMDEMEFEQVDDGTRISMTKYYKDNLKIVSVAPDNAGENLIDIKDYL